LIYAPKIEWYAIDIWIFSSIHNLNR